MTLVKLGQLILNLDLLTDARDHSAPGVAGPLHLEFQGGRSLDVHSGADALRAWLAVHATDLAPSPP